MLKMHPPFFTFPRCSWLSEFLTSKKETEHFPPSVLEAFAVVSVSASTP